MADETEKLRNREITDSISSSATSTPDSAAKSSLSDPASSSPPSSAAANHASPASIPSPAPSTPFSQALPPRKKILQEYLSTPPIPADHHRWKRLRLQVRIAEFEEGYVPKMGPGDVELSLSSRDGLRISIRAHRRVLTGRGRYFTEKLKRHTCGAGSPIVVNINECDDVETSVEVVIMMYCENLRRRLAGEEVMKVLGLLKVSMSYMFDAGIDACLGYLEAVPWTEDEEKEVIAVIRRLQLHVPVTAVLDRVSVGPASPYKADSIFLQIVAGIIQVKDENAGRGMKALLSGLLREDTAQGTGHGARLDVSKETLYHLCRQCLISLHHCLSEAVSNNGSPSEQGGLTVKIARVAGNVQWLLEILTSNKMGDEFVKLWADQTELATLHSRIPCMHRYEISEITAQLCVALGKRQILVGTDARLSLLRTWLEALYEDFRWMRNSRRTYERKVVEEGLCQTVLTLPMAEQQTILLRWFDCFLEKGGDCPNIQPAFEVWWRRAFVRRIVAN